MPRNSQPELMLTEALNELEDDWIIARAEWRDEARVHFEEEFIEEIRSEVRLAAGAMAEVTLLLKRVVQECA